MNAKLVSTVGIAMLAGVALVSVAGWRSTAVTATDAIVSHLPGAAAQADNVRDQPGRQEFSESQALSLISGKAAQRVEETIARPQPGGDGDVLAAAIDGRAISLSDLDLTEFKFVPATLRAESSVGTFAEFVEPTDAWVAVWTRAGVAAPDWDGIPATIRVIAVMKDGSGDIRSLHVQRINPAAGDMVPN